MTGLAVDVAIFILSVSLISGLQMQTQKRMLVLAVFGCRLLYVPLYAKPVSQANAVT